MPAITINTPQDNQVYPDTVTGTYSLGAAAAAQEKTDRKSKTSSFAPPAGVIIKVHSDRPGAETITVNAAINPDGPTRGEWTAAKPGGLASPATYTITAVIDDNGNPAQDTVINISN